MVNPAVVPTTAAATWFRKAAQDTGTSRVSTSPITCHAS